MKTRRRFTAEFKAKVALEAMQGHRTITDLASRHELHPNLIMQWKPIGLTRVNGATRSTALSADAFLPAPPAPFDRYRRRGPQRAWDENRQNYCS
jgi:Transposase